jgi:FKBP-type peptidyl-prolyl cis-trans isomerase 2
MRQAERVGGGVPLEPGMRVRHPDRPDWGIGQVQSVVGHRVTVNFEDAGKVLVNTAVVALEPVEA